MAENEKNMVQMDEACTGCCWWSTMACDGKLVGVECKHSLFLKDNMVMFNKLDSDFQHDCQTACQEVYEKYRMKFQAYCLDKTKFVEAETSQDRQ